MITHTAWLLPSLPARQSLCTYIIDFVAGLYCLGSAPDYIWTSDISGQFSHMPIQFEHVGENIWTEKTCWHWGPQCKKHSITTKTVNNWVAENNKALNMTTWLQYDHEYVTSVNISFVVFKTTTQSLSQMEKQATQTSEWHLGPTKTSQSEDDTGSGLSGALSGWYIPPVTYATSKNVDHMSLVQWCCLGNRLYNSLIPPWGVVLHTDIGRRISNGGGEEWPIRPGCVSFKPICDRIWEKGPLRVVLQSFQFLAIFTIPYCNHEMMLGTAQVLMLL